MKYLNSLVFLGLMIMVAGCQKKEKAQPKKSSHHTSARVAKEEKGEKKGPTKLETKKSVAQKNDHKKVAPKKAAVKTAPKKADVAKKAAPKKNNDKKPAVVKKASDAKNKKAGAVIQQYPHHS